MALIVEDGTGMAGAESYASVSQADAYWAKRPQNALATTWAKTSTTTEKKEGALREASDYIDATWGTSFLGGRATSAQGRLWPRITVLTVPGARVPLYAHYGIARPYLPSLGYLLCETDPADVDLTIVYGADGYALDALPLQLVNATIELAGRAVTQRLALDYADGQRVKMEKAGDTAFEYFDIASTPTFGIVSRLLGLILTSGGQPGWAWR